MARDRLIDIAIARWAGRFVVNGVALSDFQEVTGSLERWGDWCRAWSARAAEYEDAGRQALAAGDPISAGEHLERAAAFEKRIKACIGLSGPCNRHDGWAESTPMTKAAFMQRSGSKTMAEAEEASKQLSLEGVASQTACPLFLVTGDDDTIVPPASTARIAEEASGPTRFLVVPRGGHNTNNRRYCYDAVTADWMAEQLRAVPPEGSPSR